MKNKKYNVFWTTSATKDLERIIIFIAHDSIPSAEKIYQQIQLKSIELNTFPKHGRIVPELLFFNLHFYRELIYERWRMIYRIADQNVYVLGVFDQRQDLHDILLERVLPT